MFSYYDVLEEALKRDGFICMPESMEGLQGLAGLEPDSFTGTIQLGSFGHIGDTYLQLTHYEDGKRVAVIAFADGKEIKEIKGIAFTGESRRMDYLIVDLRLHLSRLKDLILEQLENMY